LERKKKPVIEETRKWPVSIHQWRSFDKTSNGDFQRRRFSVAERHEFDSPRPKPFRTLDAQGAVHPMCAPAQTDLAFSADIDRSLSRLPAIAGLSALSGHRYPTSWTKRERRIAAPPSDITGCHP
jgi:hypothetical protein